MAYKIVKQFNPESATVWVEKLSTEDNIESFETESDAIARKAELELADNSRLYKIIEE